MITVLVADDHPLLRQALVALLRTVEDIDVVGVAVDGREAIELTLATSPDVVLMDLEMPRVNGIEATHALAEADSGARVVVLTSFSDRDRILGALDAGALGYLLKDAEPEDIIRGVRAASIGDSPLAPRAAREMISDRTQRSSAPDLSTRESEVLVLVAEGLPNKLIARRLAISEKTVKAHLTRVFAELGVTDRTQAALWARRHKLGPGEV